MKKLFLLTAAFVGLTLNAQNSNSLSSHNNFIDDSWIEISNNNCWLKVESGVSEPILSLKLITEEGLNINADNPVILFSSSKLVQLRPSENYKSEKVGDVYIIRPDYSGNLSFLANNTLTKISVQAENKTLNYEIPLNVSKKINYFFKSQKRDLTEKGVDKHNYNSKINQIIEAVSKNQTNKTKFPTSIKFTVKGVSSKHEVEIIRHLKISLKQQEEIFKAWESLTDKDRIYKCAVMY